MWNTDDMNQSCSDYKPLVILIGPPKVRLGFDENNVFKIFFKKECFLKMESFSFLAKRD